MWQVTLTARHPRDPQELQETTVRIYSDSALDLLKNQHYKWGVLEHMMEKGSLTRISIDYRPNHTGVRRIRKEDDGLYYLYIDGIQHGEGKADRGEAWEQGEGVVRAY